MSSDRKGIEQVKAQFEAITQLAQEDFSGSLNYQVRMNGYTAVYNYAVGASISALSTTNVGESYARHEELYVDFQEMLTRFMIRFSVDPRWTDVELFYRIVKWWRHYKVVQKWNLRTFDYISRIYIQQWSKMPLHQVSMSIFLEQLFRKHEAVVRNTLFDMIARERQHESTDRESIQTAIEMYAAMSVDGLNPLFVDNFIKPLTAATTEFYRKESNTWSLTDSATEYLMKAEQRLTEEKARCMKYFSLEHEKRVVESAEAALLDTELAKRVLFRSPGGFAAVVERRDTVNLKRFYRMFAHIPSGLDLIAATLKERLIFEGSEKARMHSGSEKDINAKQCVTDMVSIQEDFTLLTQTCFTNNPVIMKALREGLERIFSNGITATDVTGKSQVIPFSELLAVYLDLLMRQPGDEPQVESAFDQVVNVLRYVTDSDHFQQHARELLAKRLLSQTVKPNESLERLLLTRLKQRCGSHFTTQFEGMMNDRLASIELGERFRSSNDESDARLPYEMHVMVLKTGIWPKLPTEDTLSPPMEIVDGMRAFTAFYCAEAKHRVLRWSHSSSHLSMIARFRSGVKELQATAFQGWVLLQYNDQLTWTIAELHDKLKVDVEELKRVLVALTKLKILLRCGPEGSVPVGGAATATATQAALADSFQLNAEFSSSYRKILVPVALSRISVSGSAKMAHQVEEDRKPAIDACLVRVMKSRRELGHTELVNECIAQLASRFAPDARAIKLRIEDLIKREFIERCGDSGGTYRYLA